jgi:hypothetical protein
MSRNMLARYSKECLLKVNKTSTCVSDSPKKFAIGDKIKPLSFQRVGPESGQPKVTWLGHLILPFETRKCEISTCAITSKRIG